MFQEMMCANNSSGGSTIDVNYVRSKVLSNPTYTFTPASGRCTVNEGGIYVDTTSKMVYVYADLSFTITISPSGDIRYGVCSTTVDSVSINPCVSNQEGKDYILITSETTDANAIPYCFGYSQGLEGMTIFVQKCTNGTRSKMYGVYTLGKI